MRIHAAVPVSALMMGSLAPLPVTAAAHQGHAPAAPAAKPAAKPPAGKPDAKPPGLPGQDPTQVEGKCATADRLYRVFDEADADKSGRLSEPEWAVFRADAMEKRPAMILAKGDRDGDGKMSEAEWAALRPRIGRISENCRDTCERHAPEQVERMTARLDDMRIRRELLALLDPEDPRLPAMDERIAALYGAVDRIRSEFPSAAPAPARPDGASCPAPAAVPAPAK